MPTPLRSTSVRFGQSANIRFMEVTEETEAVEDKGVTKAACQREAQPSKRESATGRERWMRPGR